MSLLCLVLFIMPSGRSYLWLIILKQFLYFISVEFPLEDATKEANHANKAYRSRGTREKKQIMLLHICRSVKFTRLLQYMSLFFFFSLFLFFSFPEWVEMILSHSCCTSLLSLTCRMRESVSRLGAGNWNSALCAFCHTIPFKICSAAQQVDSANHEASHPKTVNW